jgi:predicted secreted protein
MKRVRTFAFAAAGLLVAAVAVAQQQRPDSLERRLDRIEQALGMMENCREMMKDGGMIGGGRPNEQWRKPAAGK